MFNNPGKKIKTLAKVLYWIIALGSLATAIFFVAENSYWGLDIEIILIAVAIAAGGFLAAFLSNLGLYAFGELVENSGRLVELAEAAQSGKSPAQPETAPAAQP